MSKKLWIAHQTAEKIFGPTRVSFDGCEYVDDFKGIFYNILLNIQKKLKRSSPMHLVLMIHLNSLSFDRTERQKLKPTSLLLIT